MKNKDYLSRTQARHLLGGRNLMGRRQPGKLDKLDSLLTEYWTLKLERQEKASDWVKSQETENDKVASNRQDNPDVRMVESLSTTMGPSSTSTLEPIEVKQPPIIFTKEDDLVTRILKNARANSPEEEKLVEEIIEVNSEIDHIIKSKGRFSRQLNPKGRVRFGSTLSDVAQKFPASDRDLGKLLYNTVKKLNNLSQNNYQQDK